MSTPTQEATAKRLVSENPTPFMSPGHVQRSFKIVSETVVSIRNAARYSKIQGTNKDVLRLADDAKAVATQLLALAEELRRAAQ